MRLKAILTALLFATPLLASEESAGPAVPTLGEWSLVLFLGLLTLCALFFMRRRNAWR